MSEPRVVLITGTSSGIGRACALHLRTRGYRVYGSSRQDQTAPLPPFAPTPMDVNDEASGTGCSLGEPF